MTYQVETVNGDKVTVVDKTTHPQEGLVLKGDDGKLYKPLAHNISNLVSEVEYKGEDLPHDPDELDNQFDTGTPETTFNADPNYVAPKEDDEPVNDGEPEPVF